MRTVLITGSNRGIGLEYAKQYLQSGDRVLATCRHPDEAEELHQLHQQYPVALSVHVIDGLTPQRSGQILVYNGNQTAW